ncbi:ABC transporter permease subunit [Agromyces badenianii]|uniref:ABC transporter permease subunit n=1 Tax=Agromyces badenianii TaxID=2080742 RepID=UPI000D591B63|nr:ABC transporter permease [Agromyces badenianii]PWC05646.1 hypothetical protein DCE94_05165 [Agromyces badenianii]
MNTRILRSVALRLVGLAAGLAASALVMLVTGNDVGGFIDAIGAGFGSNLDSTLRWFAPLLLAGVAGVIAFRDGAFNLGLDGQIYLGAAASSVVALGVGRDLDPFLGVSLAIVAAIAAGAAVAGVCALLRLLFGTPEVITTLVMNPLCAIVVTLLVTGPLAPGGAAGNTESSEVIPEQLWLPSLSPHSLATAAVSIALAVVAIVAVYYRFTIWGFESRLFGAAPTFSFYAGFRTCGSSSARCS